MRKYAWLILSAGLVLSLVGCGDSGSSNGGGSGGTAGTGGTAGSGGTGGGTATVSGIVYAADDGDGTPFQGATVSVVGGAETTSGVGGVFSLEAPVGVAALVATAGGHWGELQLGDVPAGGLSGLEPELVPDAMVAEVAAALMQTVDTAKGIVAVEFANPASGNSADLGASYGFAFVFNSDDEPVIGTELLPGGGGEVIFVNVDVGADAMPSAKNAADADCTLDSGDESIPVQAKVISSVFASCP